MHPGLRLALFAALLLVSCNDGFEPVPIEHEPPALYDAPDWSPTGSEIAVHRDGRRGTEVWLYDIASHRCAFVVHGFNPSWSPDGRVLAYCDSYLWVDTLATGHRRRLTGFDACLYPRWSPSGDRIVFDRGDPPELAGIYIYDLASGGTTRAAAPHGRMADWSPAGDKLVLVEDTGSMNRRLMVLDLESGETSALPSGVAVPKWNPRWSPDGSRIAYVTRSGIGVLDLVSGDDRILPHTREQRSGAQGCGWDHEGRHLVYNDGSSLWQIDPDTGERRTLGCRG